MAKRTSRTAWGLAATLAMLLLGSWGLITIRGIIGPPYLLPINDWRFSFEDYWTPAGPGSDTWVDERRLNLGFFFVETPPRHYDRWFILFDRGD